MITVLRATPLLIAILLWPAQLYAHAQLRSAEPASGAVLSHAPANVALHFNEPVTPLRSRWFRPDGAAIDVQSQSMGDSLIVTVPIDVSPGTHMLSWRVVRLTDIPWPARMCFRWERRPQDLTWQKLLDRGQR